MIFLKVIPDTKPVELNILTELDAFIFAIIAILLIIVFIKVKFFKKSVEPKNFYEKQHTHFEIESRDVLMQPKKKVDESEIPFKDFSLDPFHIILTIILFIIYLFFLDATW